MKKTIGLLFIIVMTISCTTVESTKNNALKVFDHSYETAGKVKAFFIEPDSIKLIKKKVHYQKMSTQFAEYASVTDFFNQSNSFLLEKNGELYRVIDLKITDNGSIIHKYDDTTDEVKYFYKTDNNFYLYTFLLKEGKLDSCTNVRRIKNGYFDQPVHDLIFENGRLVKEEFVAEVSKNFYKKDGIQYFEIEKEIDGGLIINQYNLGTTKDF